MRRFLIILLILLLLLPLIGIAAVQVVLSTDLPRRMVLEQLEDATGLAFHADELRTGWSGRTSLTNLTVTIPLEDEPLLAVPRVDASHRDLLRLILFQSLKLDEVQALKPVIFLRENADGGWNVTEAARIVRRRRAQQPEEDPADTELPRVIVREATVKVVRNDAAEIEYRPLSLRGEPVRHRAWAFEAALLPYAEINGRFVPDSLFRHEATFELKQLNELLQPWVDGAPAALSARGRWTGRATEGGVTGRLDLQDATVGEVQLAGALRVTGGDRQVNVRPDGLIVGHPALRGETMRVTSGVLSADAQALHAQNLRLAGLETNAAVDGRWDLTRQRGEAGVAWSGRIAQQDVRHRGEMTVNASKPDDRPFSLRAEVTSEITAGDGLAATVDATVEGSPASSVNGVISFPALRLQANQSLDLGGSVLRLTLDWPMLKLTELSVPQATVTRTKGQINLDDRQWSLELAAAKINAPQLDQPLDVELIASGDFATLDFSSLQVTHPNGQLLAAGTYEFSGETPLQSRASLNINLPDSAGDHVTAPAGERAGGQLKADLQVTGHLQPLDLDMVGNLLAMDFPVRDGVISRLDIPCRAHIDAEHASVQSSDFAAFDGRWSLAGELALDDRDLRVTLTTQQASLEELSNLLAVDRDIRGTLSAAVDMELPRMDQDLLQLQGSWSVTDLQAEGFTADHGTGSLDTRSGRIFVEDIELQNGDGRITGSLNLGMRDNSHVAVDLAAHQWPWQPQGADAALLIAGAADMTVDVRELTAEGDLDLQAAVRYGETDLGHIAFNGSAEGRTLTVKTLSGSTFGGSLEGSGRINIEDWKRADATVTWRDIDLTQLAMLIPEMQGFTGASSGTIIVDEAVAKRHPEPLRIRISAESTQGEYQGLQFGGFEMLAFLGAERFMLDRSTFEIAGGSIDIWGRITDHNGQRHSHAFLDLRELELNQFAQMIDPESAPMPGVLSGHITGGGYLAAPHRTFGTGRIDLAKSDLAAFAPIEMIYNTLQLSFARREPEGEGTVQVQLEGESLIMKRFDYFNRGTNVVGSGTIGNIWAGAESPVEVVLVGSVLPFHDLDLPVVSDLDRLIGTLQSDATSVRVSGTLADYEVRVIPFSEIGSTVQRLLRASVSGQ